MVIELLDLLYHFEGASYKGIALITYDDSKTILSIGFDDK